MRVKKGWIAAGVTIGVLILGYAGVSVYFGSHFFRGTTVNGTDVSGAGAAQAGALLASEAEAYTLTVEEADQSEVITGEAISLEMDSEEAVERLLKEQNAFLWPEQFWKTYTHQMEAEVRFDEQALTEVVSGLACVTNTEVTVPASSKPEFDGEKFVPGAETYGTAIDSEKLESVIISAVQNMESFVSLTTAGVYEMPKYTSESPEVQTACDEMNKYLTASITYNMSPQTEVVDKALISGWVSCDENLNVTFNEAAVREYMRQFGLKYDTLGTTRSLTTPGGKQTEVSGGTYGWSVDEAAETEALLAHIKNGETITKEPAYVQRGAVHEAQDWGRTYVEVDLTDQYMWYVADGAVMMETAVVTGLPDGSHDTPSGVYDILYTQADTYLVGNIVPATGQPEYRTHVDYWMPVTWSGVGFHDATWQSAFGGSRYLYYGSHGCINMPLDQAAQLYQMVSAGTPVILHY